MADIKINDLTAITDPSSSDVLPIVDISNDATKKVTIADLLENAGFGSETSPGISFGSDSDTGIFRPSNNRIAASTAGVERLRIDQNGRILIGATANAGAGRVQSHTESSTNANFAALKFENGSAGPTVEFFKSRGATSGTHGLVSSGDYLGRFIFKASNGNAYRSAAAINVNVDGTPGTGNDMPGRIEFHTTSDGSGTPQARMVINSSGNCGIGTANPTDRLHVVGDAKIDGSDIRISNNNDFSSQGRTSNIRFQFAGNDAAAIKTRIPAGASSVSECVLDVFTGGATDSQRRLRIDEVGRICVGALPSAVASITNVDAGLIQTNGNIDIRYGGTNSNPGGARYLSFINTDSTLGANQPMGGIRWVGNDSDNPSADCASILAYNEGAGGLVSNIVFSNFGAERMRINNSGKLGTLAAASSDAMQISSGQSAGTSYEFLRGMHSSTAIYDGTLAFRVFTNGNVQNTNNSYGAISDIKLKENIVDASSQWDDLKAIQIRNYNFIEGQTHTQIGVVAQEIEIVSPGLVTESPDRDKDNNDLGTVTKSVNYSVLYMKAVKALQEAMTRIETLEQRLTDAGIA